MPTILDIARHVEMLADHALNGDEGVQHGDIQRYVTGVTVAWMATPDAIRAAGQAGHELLIAHESLYYPYDVLNSGRPPAGWQDWKVNRERRALLEQYGLAFMRIHGSADEICVFDAFAGLLGLGELVFSERLVKVYRIEPRPLRDLVQHVKDRLGMTFERVAAAGGMDRPVELVGLPWGGLGLFVNVSYQQRLVEQGCDVFIAGESDNYGFRFAVESGIPMIETSHELSENPGLEIFTDMLAGEFPDVRFAFHRNACVWHPA